MFIYIGLLVGANPRKVSTRDDNRYTWVRVIWYSSTRIEVSTSRSHWENDMFLSYILILYLSLLKMSMLVWKDIVQL